MNLRCVLFSGLLVASFASVASAGVCRIGTTEYETLQDALYAITNINTEVTIKLTADIDITCTNNIPQHKNLNTIIDGDGRYSIRQKYAGALLANKADFNRIVFRNVTICGGGETYQTDASIRGVVLVMNGSGPCKLTLDTGCVVSNFVAGASLFDVNHNNRDWDILVNPGAVVAHNRFTTSSSAGIFYTERWSADRSLTIAGGEFYDNSSKNATIVFLSALGQSRTPGKPILKITGGRFHDNACTGDENCGLFFCDYGPMDVNMSGGEIYDNEGTAFHIRRGGGYLSRVHFSGGKVYGNTGRAVYDYQSDSTGSMLVSGDAIVAGNGLACIGLYEKSEWLCTSRTVLEGPLTGYVQLSGTGNSTSRGVGKVYGTNALDYAGAENIRQDGSYRVLTTDAETGNLVWAEPKAAQIGSTKYSTLADALSAVKDGQTIELLYDCPQTAAIVPPANKAITIDGSGHRIFRSGAFNLVDATTAGGNITFTDVQLDAGRYFNYKAGTNDLAGAIVNTHDGVAATVTLGTGTVLVGGNGTNALVHVANGATVNLDGAVVTGQLNKAVCVAAGGTFGIRGATLVKDNVTGDIDVANGTVLVQNGNFTGAAHVTVAGVEPFEGQQFGLISGAYTGYANFIKPGTEKIYVSAAGGVLQWRRKGLMLVVR